MVDVLVVILGRMVDIVEDLVVGNKYSSLTF
jgi:hypothetical protein